jgi:aminopeptidase N
MNRWFLVFLVLLLARCNQNGWTQRAFGPTDSGGPLMEEQAAYDVTFYELGVEVFPEEKAIAGELTVKANVIRPMESLVLDLDTVFTVKRVTIAGDEAGGELEHENRNGKLWIELPGRLEAGEVVEVTISYAGKPREARNPPWGGGFTWSLTSDGHPWIATSVQGEGADLWWPCKDHPSDEPDSMAIHITVPRPLVAASNGVLREVTEESGGKRTYSWFVPTPINNYGVALNVAPYEVVEGVFKSIAGEEVPVSFWVLPERKKEAEAMLPQFIDHLRFFEKYLGPYPFRTQKYGVAHTPFLGMEHQTIIAYGSTFSNGNDGYDWLHHHELAHEWWGNMVTAPDWRDFWIHEGFGTYMQPLYLEEQFGEEAYIAQLLSYRDDLLNLRPVAPQESLTADEVYFIDAEKQRADNDIYYKGAWILHTLRYVLGDDNFFLALRRMAYPSPELERYTDGRQCRFATTEDFQQIVEEVSGRDMDWFFETYLRQPEPPVLKTSREGQTLYLEWDVPDGRAFPMPVEIEIDGNLQRVEAGEGRVAVDLPGKAAKVAIDPRHRILMEVR